MKLRIAPAALVVAFLVTVAFVAIIVRWIVVADLAADVDTHRLTADEEVELLVKRAQNKKEVEP